LNYRDANLARLLRVTKAHMLARSIALSTEMPFETPDFDVTFDDGWVHARPVTMPDGQRTDRPVGA